MTENDEIQKKLQEGIELARRGDRATGRRLLQEVLNADPGNEMAWMWMASCVTTLRERRDCLEQALTINPNNERAREALERLDAAVRQAQAGTRRETIDQLRRQSAEVERARPTRMRRQAAREEEAPSRRGISLFGVAIVVLGVVAALLVVLVVPQLEIFQKEATPVPTVLRSTPTSVGDLVLFSTNTPDFAQRTSRAPTLPPTFTPTPTASPTNTPLPSATPYPLSEFEALSVSMELGAIQPSLYRMAGDGQEAPALLGGNFRDVVFSPDGTRIAFIRDVEYASAEEAGATTLLPELHIAELDNLAGARAITEMRTLIVAHPTWSPDGHWLVFVSDAQGTEDLWYVNEDGGYLRPLTSNTYIDRDPAWSTVPSSRRLVFASDIDSVGSTEIYVIDIPEPGEEATYTRLTNDSHSSYSPTWSPDGQWIVFVSDRSGDADLYYMDPNGRNQRLITVDDNGAEDRNPAFTPDGRFVAFTSNRQDDRFQSYLLSLGGDVLLRLTDVRRNDVALIYRPEPDLPLSR